MTKKTERFSLEDGTIKRIEKMLEKQRIRVLAKYVDRHFIDNPDFIDKIESFMNGNIKAEIIEALDAEYSILRDDPDDEGIAKMIEEKVINFIEELYPQKNFKEK